MIQNLLAELDAPEEFYFNKSSRVLYFFPNRTVANGTAPQPPTAEELGGQLGVVRLQNLLRIEGAGAGPTAVPGQSSGWKPATNITVRGIGFRDAGYTYLAPHGAPRSSIPCRKWIYRASGSAQGRLVSARSTPDRFFGHISSRSGVISPPVLPRVASKILWGRNWMPSR